MDEKVIKVLSRNELIDVILKELKTQGSDADLNHIDVSSITSMCDLFYYVNLFVTVGNIKIDKWNVSNVIWMEGMFYKCIYFTSDLSKWDVSKVTNMAGMFNGCESFNSDLSKWDVSRVLDMDDMFVKCKMFSSDLSKWEVSENTHTTDMFKQAKKMDSSKRPKVVIR